jgi:hypothetical protein
MSKAVRQTRAHWAAKIRAAHKQTVAAFLKTGCELIAAKKALRHGDFLKMIQHDLPFAAATAQRLMKIAADPKMRNAAHAQLLPSSWPTLYELTKLPDATFKQAAMSGAINPTMTRRQATSIRVAVSYSPKRIVVPFYVKEIDADASIAKPTYQTENSGDDETLPRMRLVAQSEPTNVSPSDIASLAVTQIERLVSDLVMAVERGDINTGPSFDGRIRVVANRLLLLIERERATIQ